MTPEPSALPRTRLVTQADQYEYTHLGEADGYHKKVEKARRKIIHKELTFLDVRQAARDGQKVFDRFIVTSKLATKK